MKTTALVLLIKDLIRRYPERGSRGILLTLNGMQHKGASLSLIEEVKQEMQPNTNPITQSNDRLDVVIASLTTLKKLVVQLEGHDNLQRLVDLIKPEDTLPLEDHHDLLKNSPMLPVRKRVKKSEKTEALFQNILDYIRDHPECTSQEIGDGIPTVISDQYLGSLLAELRNDQKVDFKRKFNSRAWLYSLKECGRKE